MAKIVPDLIVTQMFRGHSVMLSQRSDSTDAAPLDLLAETEEFHLFEEFTFDWI